MKKIKFLSVLALLSFCGCALFTPPVPESKWTWENTTTLSNGVVHSQKLVLSNPKNFGMTNLVAHALPDGTPELTVGSASSVNDANAINAGYGGQAAYLDALTRFVQTIGGMAPTKLATPKP